MQVMPCNLVILCRDSKQGCRGLSLCCAFLLCGSAAAGALAQEWGDGEIPCDGERKDMNG